jgi:hypothetical protein
MELLRAVHLSWRRRTLWSPAMVPDLLYFFGGRAALPCALAMAAAGRGYDVP